MFANKRYFLILICWWSAATGALAAEVSSSKPSFDCLKAKSALGLTLCSGTEGAAADWKLVATSWAFVTTLDETSRRLFWREQDAFFASVAQRCGIVLPPDSGKLSCAVGAYESRANALRARLPREARVEIDLGPERRAQIQASLVDLGFLRGDPDGEFGADTRAAIKTYQASTGAPPTGFLSDPQLAALAGTSTPNRSVASQPPSAAPAAPANRPARGEFTRLMSLPAACEAARAQGRANLVVQVPMMRLNAPGPACAAVTQCFQDLVSLTDGALGYLRRNPAVWDAVRKQIQAQFRENPEGLATALANDVSQASRIATDRCDYLWMTVENYWLSNLGNPASPSPRKMPIEKLLSAGQAVQSAARADFEAAQAEYQSLKQGVDRYPGIEKFDQAFAAYKQAFDRDDLADLLQKQEAFGPELNAARSRKALLVTQTDRLSALAKTADGLGQFGSASLDMRLSKAKARVQALQSEPPERRGDVSSGLSEVSTELDDLGSWRTFFSRADDIRRSIDRLEAGAANPSDGQKAYIAGLRSDLRRLLDEPPASREDGAAKLAAIAARAVLLSDWRSFAGEIERSRQRPEAAALMRRLEGAALEQTQQLFEIPARFASAPVATLNDEFTDAKLKSSQAQWGSVSRYQAELAELDHFKSDLSTLQQKIASKGADLLDAGAKAKVERLSAASQSVEAAKIPLSGSSKDDYADARKTLTAMLGSVDALMDKRAREREVERLGLQYAVEAGTRWTVEKKPNPMTDRTDWIVRTVQKTEDGVVAEIEARCHEPGIFTFTALLVDENGKPTLTFPGRLSDEGLMVSKRINSEKPTQGFLATDEFNNRFVLFSMPREDRASVWRVLVQMSTSKGEIVLKVPLFEDKVRQALDACYP